MRGLEFPSTRWVVLVALLSVSCGGSVIDGGAGSGGSGAATGGGGSTGSGNGGHGCPAAAGQAVKLAALQQMPGSVALSDSDVFYMDMTDYSLDTGKLMRISKSGGSPVQVAGGIAGPSDLITVAGSPYWTNWGWATSGGQALMGGSLSGLSGPIDTPGVPRSLTWNGERLFYVGDFGGVRSAGLSGHDVKLLGGPASLAIAADKSGIYLLELDDSVLTMPVTGGSVSPFAPALCQLQTGINGSILVDQDTVYWLDLCGWIWKKPKTGGTPTSIAKNTVTSYTGLGHRIAQDAKRIYWIGPGATINAADKSTGAVTTLATTPNATKSAYQGGIAVDATSIYWTYKSALWCTRKP